MLIPVKENSRLPAIVSVTFRYRKITVRRFFQLWNAISRRYRDSSDKGITNDIEMGADLNF
jgi:hypothetical protein